MPNIQAIKSEQLGMPFGTASHRLRTIIMFTLAQKCNMDTCCICGELITCVEEFSIQHKVPWLHAGQDLFWDIDNIGFAHRLCNVKEARQPIRKTGGLALRKVGPDGKMWCAGHKAFLDSSFFTKNSSRWNGLEKYCRDCRPVARISNIASEAEVDMRGPHKAVVVDSSSTVGTKFRGRVAQLARALPL